jgi:hypothetical protein
MTHFRTTIRDKAAALLTGLATTGSHVYSGRVAPLTPQEMPGLVIVPAQESADHGAYSSGKTAERVLQLIIIGEAAGNEGLFDVLDGIAGEVEAALFAEARENLDGLAVWIDPPATEMTVNGEGDRRIGTVRMAFPVHYRTALADPASQA